MPATSGKANVHGVISSSQRLASEAGARALQAGGTCVDAAIAAAAVLNVVEPFASHLGGDLFALVHEPGAPAPVAVNGSGRSPAGLDPESLRGIPLRGLAAATVPGQVDAWSTLHLRWGHLPWRTLLEPAITLARDGVPVSPEWRAALAGNPDVHSQPGFAAQFLPTGRLPDIGQLLRFPDLARTLEAIADDPRSFYEGPLADRLVAAAGRIRPWFTTHDLAAHHTRVEPSLMRRHGRWRVHEQPAPSQGVITLAALGIAEHAGLAALELVDPRRAHVLIEAVKLAFADKRRYWGDPEHTALPAAAWLDDAYLARQAKRIDLDRAQSHVPGPLSPGAQHTTYLCAADARGGAVSFIQSVYWEFGCGVVLEGTGVLLNNRMNGFTTLPDLPNTLAPGKRPVHTLNTWMVYGDRGLRWVGGTPGGDKQVQWNVQVLSGLLHQEWSPREAVARARWWLDETAAVNLESHLGGPIVAGLRRRGHAVRVLGAFRGGGKVQVLHLPPEGGYDAACDPRCAGLTRFATV